jgi:hypothetical protein
MREGRSKKEKRNEKDEEERPSECKQPSGVVKRRGRIETEIRTGGGFLKPRRKQEEESANDAER